MEEREKAKYAPNDLTIESKKNKEKLVLSASYSGDEEWVQEHIRQFGEEPSFF